MNLISNIIGDQKSDFRCDANDIPYSISIILLDIFVASVRNGYECCYFFFFFANHNKSIAHEQALGASELRVNSALTLVLTFSQLVTSHTHEHTGMAMFAGCCCCCCATVRHVRRA